MLKTIMFTLSKYLQQPQWYTRWFNNILNELFISYCFYNTVVVEQGENNDIGYNIDIETDIVMYDMHKTPSFEEMPTDYIITINDSYNQCMV